MKWNREEVCRLLNARVTDEELVDGDRLTTLKFEDSLMLYEVWIHRWVVILCADPEKPIQGLPFFEISIPCTELAPVPRSGMPTGIGMFFGSVSPASLWFSITRREDGNISLSGSWPGLAEHAETCIK